MSDREMRDLLEAVIEDIDTGKVQVRRAGRIYKLVGTGLVAAAIGLSGGCSETAVGTDSDASPTADAVAVADAAVDGGPVDLYGMPIPDAALAPDAEADAAVDAEVDAEILPPYAAPAVYDFSPA